MSNTRRFKSRLQFRLVSLVWLTLVVAAFFFGRNLDTLSRVANPNSAMKTGTLMLGACVSSDPGVLGQIQIEDANFSLDAIDLNAEWAEELTD